MMNLRGVTEEPAPSYSVSSDWETIYQPQATTRLKGCALCRPVWSTSSPLLYSHRVKSPLPPCVFFCNDCLRS